MGSRWVSEMPPGRATRLLTQQARRPSAAMPSNSRFAACPQCKHVVAVGIKCPYCGADPVDEPAVGPLGEPEPVSGFASEPGGRGASRATTGGISPSPPSWLRARPKPEGHRGRWWLRLAILGAVLLGATGGVVWLVWPRPYPLGLSDKPVVIEYRFSDAAAESERDTLETMVESAEGLISGYAGGHMGSLTIVAGADQTALTRLIADETGSDPVTVLRTLQVDGYVTRQSTVFVDLSGGLGPSFYQVPAYGVSVAFQLAPLYAADIVRCTTSPDAAVTPAGPMWLFWGMPDFVRTQAFFDSGYWALSHETSPEVGKAQIIASGSSGTSYRLFDLRTRYPWGEAPNVQPVRDLAYAGVSLLVDRAGMRSLFEYWQRLANGECWDEAFEHAFGTPIDAFYEAFEAQRAHGT